VHAVDRDALVARDLHDAGRDGLGLLAVAERERGVAAVAVVVRDAHHVAEAR
jgi:hypothetical protein